MNKIIAILYLLGLATTLFAEKLYYISPDGSDSADGTIDAPFRSLEKARDTIRGLPLNDRKQNIRVLLRAGTYFIEETFVLNVEDGAPSGLQVSYEAFPGEQPILDSGVDITGWRKAVELPEGVPQAAAGKLYVADLPDGLERFYALFDETGFIARARVPFQSDPTMPMSIDGTRTRWLERDVLHFKPGPFREWHNLADIEIYLKPTRNWVCNFLQLKSVDLERNIARTTVEGTYKLSGHLPRKSRTNDIEQEMVIGGELCNVPEGLNRPGTWSVDTVERKVYLWPASEAQLKQRIVAPSLREYIRIDGVNDEWGDGDVPVQGIVVRGITFRHGKRFVFEKDDRGIQHDWELFDEGNAYLRLRGAENCAVEECTFINGANSGVRLDLYAQNNRISGNHIDNLGYTGILLCGYGPGTKDVNRNNLITNNEISRVGQLWFHALGIFVFQSGYNTISHNYIHDTLYDAVVVSGVRPRFFGYRFKDFPDFPEEYPDLREIMRIMRWDEIGGKPSTFKSCLDYAHSRGNVIEYNEIAAAMVEGGDGNALYLSGTFGNTFRYNMVYASPTPPGMFRNDDEQYESLFYGNILIGMDQPRLSGANLKHENTFENNMILNWGQDAIGKVTSLDPEHEKGSPGTRISRNILWHPKANTAFIGAIDVHYGDNNIFFAEGNPEGSADWLALRQAQGMDGNSVAEDPMFADLENLNFKLLPSSPALQRGFQQIPFESIGLTRMPAIKRLRMEGLTMSELMNGQR